MSPIFDFFLQPYQNASLLDISLEVIAVIFGVVGVWYGKKESILVYPLGIISTVIFIYICFNYQLYGDFIINIYYTLMSIYGWFMWSKLVKGEHIKITQTNFSDKMKTFGIFVVSAAFIVGVYMYFDRFDRMTDYFDTLTTGLCFAAMWLMANKKIEHWLLWIVANIISIPLYFYKGLGFTGLQFILLLIIAISGYYSWKKHLNNNQVPA